MHTARPTSPIVLLLLALLVVLASGEAFAFVPATSSRLSISVGSLVSSTDGSQTLIVSYDFYPYRGLVIAPNGDFLVIDNRSAPSAQLINGLTETVVAPVGSSLPPWRWRWPQMAIC